jgi:hypothetical protein
MSEVDFLDTDDVYETYIRHMNIHPGRAARLLAGLIMLGNRTVCSTSR